MVPSCLYDRAKSALPITPLPSNPSWSTDKYDPLINITITISLSSVLSLTFSVVNGHPDSHAKVSKEWRTDFKISPGKNLIPVWGQICFLNACKKCLYGRVVALLILDHRVSSLNSARGGLKLMT